MDEFNVSYHFDEDTLKELKRGIAVFGPDFELVAVYKDFLFRDMKYEFIIDCLFPPATEKDKKEIENDGPTIRYVKMKAIFVLKTIEEQENLLCNQPGMIGEA